jgi:hypothetical protein
LTVYHNNYKKVEPQRPTFFILKKLSPKANIFYTKKVEIQIINIPNISHMSLDWFRAFRIDVTGRFSEAELRRTVRETLTDHPDPGTPQYVAVLAQSLLLELLESQIRSAHEKDDAERRTKEFLLYHPVVQDYRYKQTFHVLAENQRMAQESDQHILNQIDKVRIVLETAISVTLTDVSSPPEDPSSSVNEEDFFDDEALRRSRDKYDIHLYGPYLHLVRDMPNRHDIPRW